MFTRLKSLRGAAFVALLFISTSSHAVTTFYLFHADQASAIAGCTAKIGVSGCHYYNPGVVYVYAFNIKVWAYFPAGGGGCAATTLPYTDTSNNNTCLAECPDGQVGDSNGICQADPCTPGYTLDGECFFDITIDDSTCTSDADDYQGNVTKDGVTTHICQSDYECAGGQFGVVNGVTSCVPDNYGPTICQAGTYSVVTNTSGEAAYACEPLDNNPPESGDCMFVEDAFGVKTLQCRNPDGSVIDPNSPDHKSNGGDGDGIDRNDPQSPDDPQIPVEETITKGDQLIADKIDELIDKNGEGDSTAVVDKLDEVGTGITDSIDGLTEEYNGTIEGDISTSIGSLTGDISGGALDPENVVSDMFSADYFGDAEDNMKDLAIHIDTFEGIGACNDLVISSLLGHNFVLPCSSLQKVRDVLGYVFYIWTVLVLFELLTTPITLSRN